MRNLTLVLVAFVLFSCKDDTMKHGVDTSKFVMHSMPNHFSIETPIELKATRGLNPDASLQLENRSQEVYLAIIEEDKQEVISNFELSGVYNKDLSPVLNYLNVQMNGFSSGLTVIEKQDPEKLSINGMTAYNVEMVAQPEEVEVSIYYLFTFIEGKDTLYMCMQWTVAQQREEFENTFAAIIETFEEIP